MGQLPYYANAVRAEPGQCFRMVSRDDGYRKGSPTPTSNPCGGSAGARWARKRCGCGRARATPKGSRICGRLAAPWR